MRPKRSGNGTHRDGAGQARRENAEVRRHIRHPTERPRRALNGLITQRSQVQILPPLPPLAWDFVPGQFLFGPDSASMRVRDCVRRSRPSRPACPG